MAKPIVKMGEKTRISDALGDPEVDYIQLFFKNVAEVDTDGVMKAKARIKFPSEQEF